MLSQSRGGEACQDSPLIRRGAGAATGQEADLSLQDSETDGMSRGGTGGGGLLLTQALT